MNLIRERKASQRCTWNRWKGGGDPEVVGEELAIILKERIRAGFQSVHLHILHAKVWQGVVRTDELLRVAQRVVDPVDVVLIVELRAGLLVLVVGWIEEGHPGAPHRAAVLRKAL
eukprot:scaffold1638_cov258-Pinguiococcus_pyrenoidosus.AAC.50